MEIEVTLDNLKVIPLGVNQYIIESDRAQIFQSYESIIAICTNGMVILDENKWAYSRTTSKYRCKFLREDGETTKSKIKEGRYFLAKLNK